jgi:hypothetical protein
MQEYVEVVKVRPRAGSRNIGVEVRDNVGGLYSLAVPKDKGVGVGSWIPVYLYEYVTEKSRNPEKAGKPAGLRTAELRYGREPEKADPYKGKSCVKAVCHIVEKAVLCSDIRKRFGGSVGYYMRVLGWDTEDVISEYSLHFSCVLPDYIFNSWLDGVIQGSHDIVRFVMVRIRNYICSGIMGKAKRVVKETGYSEGRLYG